MIVSSKTVKPQNVSAWAVEQLALPDHLGGLDTGVPPRVLADGRDPLRRGLACSGHPVQPPDPSPGEYQADRCQHKPDDDTQDHADLLMRRLPAPRRVRRCRATLAGAPNGPLPVQGTQTRRDHRVGRRAARSAIFRHLTGW
jgi:hypothetical protein